MLRNKTFLRIFSLVAAIFLWIYVMGEVDPETRQTIRDIPVSIEGAEILEEEGLAVVQEEELFVTAVIEGRRSDVNDVKHSGLTAYADVAACDKGKNTVKINVVVPDAVSLESVSRSSAKLKVEGLTEAQKPVMIEFTDTVSGTDKTARVLEYERDSVLATGAASAVKRVAAFEGTISANKASEDESRWVSVSLTPVTDSGEKVPGVTAETEKTKVRIQLLSVKTVDLKVVTKNLGEGMKVEKLEIPDRLQLIGPAYTVEGLEEVTGTVDLKGVEGTVSREVVLLLPEDTFVLEESNKPVAEITVKAAE